MVMTVYNPCFDGHGVETTYQQAAESAVSIFNDVTQQEAHRRSFDVLELRNSSPIGPTTQIQSSRRRLEAPSW